MGRAWVRELRCVFPTPGSRRLNFQSGWKSAALGVHVAGVRWLGWSWQVKRVSADHFDRGLPDLGAFFADTFCPVCAVRRGSTGPPRAVATALLAQLPGSSSAGPGEATQRLWGLRGLRGLWGSTGARRWDTGSCCRRVAAGLGGLQGSALERGKTEITRNTSQGKEDTRAGWLRGGLCRCRGAAGEAESQDRGRFVLTPLCQHWAGFEGKTWQTHQEIGGNNEKSSAGITLGRKILLLPPF